MYMPLAKDNDNLSVREQTKDAIRKYGIRKNSRYIEGGDIIKQMMLNQLVLIGERLEADPNDEIKCEAYSRTLYCLEEGFFIDFNRQYS